MTPLPPETTVAYVIALLFVLIAMEYMARNPGYRCPACGTSNAHEHSDDCSWSRFYEEGD